MQLCNCTSAHMHQLLVYTSSCVNHPSLHNSARQIAFISWVLFFLSLEHPNKAIDCCCSSTGIRFAFPWNVLKGLYGRQTSTFTRVNVCCEYRVCLWPGRSLCCIMWGSSELWAWRRRGAGQHHSQACLSLTALLCPKPEWVTEKRLHPP